MTATRTMLFKSAPVLLIALSVTLVTKISAAGPARRLERAADVRPNIISILADDLSYGDLGCFGQKRVRTPHLDRLAKGGMRLTDFYAGCTVCRPSRLSLWTGKHMGHTPIQSNARYVFKPEDTTVAELLRQAGYRTGGAGKWAMGGPGTTGHPNRNGFEFWTGYLDQSEAHNDYPTHLWRNDLEEDPGETTDRAAAYPDLAARLAELMEEADG